MCVNCHGCRADCCRFGVIQLTAIDLLRLSGLTGSGPSDFAHLEPSASTRTTVTWHRAGPSREMVLRQVADTYGPRCIWLLQPQPDICICQVYPASPLTCRCYPLRWFGREPVVGQAAFCPPERVQRDSVLPAEIRRLLLVRRLEWFFQVLLADLWNQSASLHSKPILGWVDRWFAFNQKAASSFERYRSKIDDELLESFVPQAAFTTNPWQQPEQLASLHSGSRAIVFIEKVLAELPAPLADC